MSTTLDEQNLAKSHAIGTIGISEDGLWHVHYIGYYIDPRTCRSRFGNWVESSRNLKKLLEIIGSRLANCKELYIEKISQTGENKDGPTHADTEFESSTD